MTRFGRVNYCSWIICGLLGILLGGCASPVAEESIASSADQQKLGRLRAISNMCKQANKINDQTYASFINASNYYMRNQTFYTDDMKMYADNYINAQGVKIIDNCYMVYAFIEEQNNNRQRSNANAAAANNSQQQQWENVGTINKVPVCTKIGTSIYCN